MTAQIVMILFPASLGLAGVTHAEGQSGGNSTPDSLSSTDTDTAKANQNKGLLRMLDREKDCPSGAKSTIESGSLEQPAGKSASTSEPCPRQRPPPSPDGKGMPGQTR
jgi:hypothetical protein